MDFSLCGVNANTPIRFVLPRDEEGDTTNKVVYALSIRAKVANAGTIWIGGDDVSNATDMDGLAPGQVMNWEFTRGAYLSEFYVLGDISADGVDFYGVTV